MADPHERTDDLTPLEQAAYELNVLALMSPMASKKALREGADAIRALIQRVRAAETTPTCATCRFWDVNTHELDSADEPTESGWHVCRAPRFPSGGTYTPPMFGCNLHAAAAGGSR